MDDPVRCVISAGELGDLGELIDLGASRREYSTASGVVTRQKRENVKRMWGLTKAGDIEYLL
jgi:hypothetical protein